MKVWIVLYNPGFEDENAAIIGVFSTEKAADACRGKHEAIPQHARPWSRLCGYYETAEHTVTTPA